MTFADDLRAFSTKTPRVAQEVFVGSVAEAHNSIVFGSGLTGAPGQVVADIGGGNLRNSWQTRFEGKDAAVISTNVPYAESNEDGIARPNGGPYRQLSAIGGRWSVKLTIVGWPRIVAAVTARLAR